MKRQHLLFYGTAAAVLVIGGAVLGFPAPTLFATALLVLCALMMILMMAGMHGGMGHGEQDHSQGPHRESHPSTPLSGGDAR